MARIFIDVWSDYVCPFCYLQMPALREFARDKDLQIHWRAFEVRPEPAPILDPNGEYLRRVWEGSVFPMAERQGMTLRLPPVQPRSRKALETAEFARHKGKFEAMHDALFKAFFEDGRNIGDTNVLLELAGAVGLNPVDLLGSLEAREYAPKVLADEKLAQRLGIHAVPGMVFTRARQPVQSGYLRNGMQSVQEIESVLARLKQPR